MGFFREVVFLDKFIRNIGEAGARIFIAVDRDVQVEVSNFETGEACITTRDDAVENGFCKFK